MLHGTKTRCEFQSPEYVCELRARANPYWYVLEYCRHIGIIRRSQKSASWLARIRTSDGKYHQKILGKVSFGEKNPQDFHWAMSAARRWFATDEIRLTSSPSFPRGSTRELMYCPFGDIYTVGHAMQDYVEWKKLAATQKHFEGRVSQINYHILPRLGPIPLAEFNGQHFQSFCVDVLETLPKQGNQKPRGKVSISDLSPEEFRRRKRVLNSVISILRVAFEMAWENGHTESERAWRCLRRVPVAERPRILFLTREESRLLLEACDPALRNLVLGGLYTGCRASELTNLRVGDVAKHGYGIHIVPSKNFRPRFVFLPDEGMAFFLKLCDGRSNREYVFTATKGKKWAGQHKHYFKIAVRKTELPDKFVFHGLRHTYASQLVQAGLSLSIVARQLGHASTQTVDQTYGHLAAQHEEEEIQRRFSCLLPEYRLEAERRAVQLLNVKESLQGENWRDYAVVEGGPDWPKSNFNRASIGQLNLINRDK